MVKTQWTIHNHIQPVHFIHIEYTELSKQQNQIEDVTQSLVSAVQHQERKCILKIKFLKQYCLHNNWIPPDGFRQLSKYSQISM